MIASEWIYRSGLRASAARVSGVRSKDDAQPGVAWATDTRDATWQLFREGAGMGKELGAGLLLRLTLTPGPGGTLG